MKSLTSWSTRNKVSLKGLRPRRCLSFPVWRRTHPLFDLIIRNSMEQTNEIIQFVHSRWSVIYPPMAKLRSRWNEVGSAARFNLTYKEKDNEAVPAMRWIWTTELCKWSVSELKKKDPPHLEGYIVSEHRQLKAERSLFFLPYCCI